MDNQVEPHTRAPSTWRAGADRNCIIQENEEGRIKWEKDKTKNKEEEEKNKTSFLKSCIRLSHTQTTMFFSSSFFLCLFSISFFLFYFIFKKVGFSVVRLAVYFIKGTGAYNVSCATIGFFLPIGSSSSSSQLCAMPRVYYIQTFIQLDAYIYQLTECVR
jgi:hypothetical protein